MDDTYILSMKCWKCNAIFSVRVVKEYTGKMKRLIENEARKHLADAVHHCKHDTKP